MFSHARVVAGQMVAARHDNTTDHNALIIRQFLSEKKIAVLEQFSRSPDLAPCNIFLFPKIQEFIKGNRFEGVVAVKMSETTEPRDIQEESFQKYIEA